jgi:hypothetical protein
VELEQSLEGLELEEWEHEEQGTEQVRKEVPLQEWEEKPEKEMMWKIVLVLA